MSFWWLSSLFARAVKALLIAGRKSTDDLLAEFAKSGAGSLIDRRKDNICGACMCCSL